MSNLSVERVAEALEKHDGRIQAAADELDAKYQTIYYWIKKYEIPYAPEKVKRTQEEVAKLYNELGSLSKVAKKIGATKEGVRMFMKRHNIPVKDLVRYDVNHDFFKKENERSLYWAGFIAADGCVKQRIGRNDFRYELSIGLSSKDHNHLEKLASDIEYNGPVRKFMIKNSKRNPKWNDTEKSEIQISSKDIFDDLDKYNIVPRKSLIYAFPKHLVGNPLVHHFIRGYFDGDGSWYWNKHSKANQLYFNLRGTHDFLSECRDMFQSNAIGSKEKKIRNNCGIGSLEYGGNGITKQIANFLYKDATIYLDRKYDIIKDL